MKPILIPFFGGAAIQTIILMNLRCRPLCPFHPLAVAFAAPADPYHPAPLSTSSLPPSSSSPCPILS
ncbi:hypothetical protein TCAL_16049 [Tigriopus californicus]|uniref:Uncharacterized protein n=1 Tax=Tigriopus californicus TaxID=6832 RepID=A0A553PNT4_TIGCA|nr:hypothetical protein TCAL_16049 [Tigriopus californicus]